MGPEQKSAGGRFGPQRGGPAGPSVPTARSDHLDENDPRATVRAPLPTPHSPASPSHHASPSASPVDPPARTPTAPLSPFAVEFQSSVHVQGRVGGGGVEDPKAHFIVPIFAAANAQRGERLAARQAELESRRPEAERAEFPVPSGRSSAATSPRGIGAGPLMAALLALPKAGASNVVAHSTGGGSAPPVLCASGWGAYLPPWWLEFLIIVLWVAAGSAVASWAKGWYVRKLNRRGNRPVEKPRGTRGGGGGRGVGIDRTHVLHACTRIPGVHRVLVWTVCWCAYVFVAVRIPPQHDATSPPQIRPPTSSTLRSPSRASTSFPSCLASTRRQLALWRLAVWMLFTCRGRSVGRS